MDAKIQELTTKIYNEGVERGQAEADRLIAEAQEKAKRIEQEAQAKAEELLRHAEAKSAELKANTERELKLHSSQLIESLKSSISEVVVGEVARANVQALVADKTFVQKLVLELVKGFDLNKGVSITTADAEGLKEYFTANAKELLSHGLHISSVAGKPTDFTIAPADGAFKLQFGEAEFLELFKSFLRPQMEGMLF